MRALSPFLAAAAAVCALGAPGRPALAQETGLVGSWSGFWDRTYFVEYRITKADRRSLSGFYGFKPPSGGGAVSYSPITCRAVSASEYNCGASSLTVNAAGSLDAVMHAQNGHTAYATLTH